MGSACPLRPRRTGAREAMFDTHVAIYFYKEISSSVTLVIGEEEVVIGENFV